jgi:hypothetical protein
VCTPPCIMTTVPVLVLVLVPAAVAAPPPPPLPPAPRSTAPTSTQHLYAAIGPAVASMGSDLEHFVTAATKHGDGNEPLLGQGWARVTRSGGGGGPSGMPRPCPLHGRGRGATPTRQCTRQPWEQHITPFPSVIYNRSWPRPYRLYYAIQTDCVMTSFMKCAADSCSIGLAESSDGINWVKPQLNLCGFTKHGNASHWPTNNLLLCPATATTSINHAIWHGSFDCNGVSILHDLNPATPDSARFKLFGGFGKPLPNASAGGTGYYISSADGLHWPAAAEPIVTDDKARWDCFPALSWDARAAEYIGYVRGPRPGDEMGCPHTWWPQCAQSASFPKQPACRDPAVCRSNFRTFSRLRSASINGPWVTHVPEQPASKEHQT